MQHLGSKLFHHFRNSFPLSNTCALISPSSKDTLTSTVCSSVWASFSARFPDIIGASLSKPQNETSDRSINNADRVYDWLYMYAHLSLTFSQQNFNRYVYIQ